MMFRRLQIIMTALERALKVRFEEQFYGLIIIRVILSCHAHNNVVRYNLSTFCYSLIYIMIGLKILANIMPTHVERNSELHQRIISQLIADSLFSYTIPFVQVRLSLERD